MCRLRCSRPICSPWPVTCWPEVPSLRSLPARPTRPGWRRCVHTSLDQTAKPFFRSELPRPGGNRALESPCLTWLRPSHFPNTPVSGRRSYRYQSVGYYVSLLAEARGHKPLPSVSTIQDLKTPAVVKVLSEDLEAARSEELPASLRQVPPERLLRREPGETIPPPQPSTLQPLSGPPPPGGVRPARGVWEMRGLRPIGAREIPDTHRPFVIEQTQRYFSGGPGRAPDPWSPGTTWPSSRIRRRPTHPPTRRRSGASRTPRRPGDQAGPHHPGRPGPDPGVRRPLHPCHHRRQPLHVSVRPAGRRRRPRGHRRSGLHPPMHQQGLPGGAPRPGTRSRFRRRSSCTRTTWIRPSRPWGSP